MTTPSQDEKINQFKDNQQPCVKLLSANYCTPGIMSRCSAGTVWHEQKKCKFASKSTVSNRCMHYIVSIDGHCDCVKAQREMSALDQVEKDQQGI